MADEETLTGSVIEPVEQRLVALTQGGDDEVVAARVATSEVYLPLRPICIALGVSWATQRRKIMADDVLMESVRTLRVQTRGGPQNLLCMDVEAIPLWLAEIEPDRVRAELRDRLRSYKRWVKKVVYDAFARETGIDVPLGASQTATPSSPDMTALAHIAQMAEAIATMARQQIGPAPVEWRPERLGVDYPEEVPRCPKVMPPIPRSTALRPVAWSGVAASPWRRSRASWKYAPRRCACGCDRPRSMRGVATMARRQKTRRRCGGCAAK
jgi:hypothetical protein